MTRRLPTAIASGAALILTATFALPGVSEGATLVCPTPPATAPANTGIPSELVLLRLKLKQYVKLKSIRISFRAELESDTGDLIVGDTSELNLKPREAVSILTAESTSPSGKPSSEAHKVIEIGNVSYRYDPTLTHGDGGRPWIRERREPSHKDSASEDSGSSFGPSSKLLGSATSIVAAGTTTIDGQTVSQFMITYPPGVYPTSELAFGELLEKECPEPVQVEMDIAASGLPIRVKVSSSYVKSGKTISSSSTTRILATNFHFKPLKRPSARQTIGQAALRSFLAAKLSKELAKHKLHHAAGHKTL
jgi:hypothetical protein